MKTVYEVHVPVVVMVETDRNDDEARREALRKGIEQVRAATRGYMMVAAGSRATALPCKR